MCLHPTPDLHPPQVEDIVAHRDALSVHMSLQQLSAPLWKMSYRVAGGPQKV